MEKSIQEDRDEFLKELTALSKKHGIVIGGCGCCESPWLESLNSNECELGERLTWDSEKSEYNLYC